MPLQRKTSKRKISRRKTRRRQHKNLFRRKRKNITYSLKGGGTFMSNINFWSRKPPPRPEKQEQTPTPEKQPQEQPQEQPQTSQPPWWLLQPQKRKVGRGMTDPKDSFNPQDTPLPEEPLPNSWFSWLDNDSAQ